MIINKILPHLANHHNLSFAAYTSMETFNALRNAVLGFCAQKRDFQLSVTLWQLYFLTLFISSEQITHKMNCLYRTFQHVPVRSHKQEDEKSSCKCKLHLFFICLSSQHNRPAHAVQPDLPSSCNMFTQWKLDRKSLSNTQLQGRNTGGIQYIEDIEVFHVS